VNSEVLNLKFFCIESSLSGVWVDSVANFGFSSKTMNKLKRHHKCCHWARTTNIGLLYPNVRNNIGVDIPIDVPQPKYWKGCMCPRHPRRGWRQCMPTGCGYLGQTNFYKYLCLDNRVPESRDVESHVSWITLMSK